MECSISCVWLCVYRKEKAVFCDCMWLSKLATGSRSAWYCLCFPGAGVGSEVVTDGNSLLEQHSARSVVSAERSAVVLPPVPTKSLPKGCPEWAARLRDCEVRHGVSVSRT